MPIKMPSKRRVWLYVTLLVLAVILYLSRHIVAERTVQLKNCVAAKYDLRRETNFRILTGACTAEGKDGSQVYVNQLRAVGDNSTSEDVQ